MEKLQNEMVELMKGFIADAEKKPSKAGHQRMRSVTLKLAKLGKEFRRVSLEEDKNA